MQDNLLDEDGYPTEEALLTIETWPTHEGMDQWFKFIESIWYMGDWGWSERRGGMDDWNNSPIDPTTIRYHVSTAGWSGNEDIIRAMQKHIFWNLSWIQSRRGGHYVFELKP